MRRRDFAQAGAAALLSLVFPSTVLAEDGEPQKEATSMTDLVTETIVVTRLFDATPEQVWKAWTEDAEVMRWWGPEHYTAPAAKMDVREGGTSLVAMRSPDGQDHWMTWRYIRVEPGRLLEYIQNLSDEQGNPVDPTAVGMPPEFPRDVVTVVSITPRGEQTETTISELTTTSAFMMKMSRLGLEQCLDKMAKTFG